MPRHPSTRGPRGRSALALLATVCAIAAPTACLDATHDADDMLESGADESSDGTDDDADDREHDGGPRLVGSAPSASPATRPPPGGRIHTAMCEGYCKELFDACERPGWDGEAECRATCNAWPLGSPGVLGPTVACHTAMLPNGTAAFGSCIAAGATSPICIDTTPSCARTCDDLFAACGPTGGLEKVADCRAWCTELPPGKPGEKLDTVACHQHYAELALTERRECQAAGPKSQVCIGK